LRIRVLRTGGFAGIALNADVDSEQLEPFERDGLKRLVEAAGFFELPAKIEAREGGADRFQYEITVEETARSHTVASGDAGMSEPLNNLVRQVLMLDRRS